MGEAKRKKALAATRTWAKGSIKIEANEQSCFEWTGTKDEAIKLQKTICGWSRPGRWSAPNRTPSASPAI